MSVTLPTLNFGKVYARNSSMNSKGDLSANKLDAEDDKVKLAHLKSAIHLETDELINSLGLSFADNIKDQSDIRCSISSLST